MPLTAEEKKLAQEVEGKLQKNLKSENSESPHSETITSKEYSDFKQENLPSEYTWYEKACTFSEKTFKTQADKELAVDVVESVKTCHINVTPEGATAFTIVGALGAFFSVLLLGMVTFLLISTFRNVDEATSVFIFFVFMGFAVALMAYIQIRKMPKNLTAKWRMKASNQMVICVFYIVTYMRHTSNLENGIRFAAEHVGFPLSLDMKRVLWNVETGNFESAGASLEDYLLTWKKYAPEFVDSMRLVESSLLQGQEQRRLDTLGNALNNILEQTYEKMLHYAHNLQGPLGNLNMLGVILPVLGMVILPLMVSMMNVDWYYLFGFYNVILFILVYNLGNGILSTRPTGYGDTDMGSSDALKNLHNYTLNLGFTKIVISPKLAAISVALICVMIGFLPMLMYQANPNIDNELSYSISQNFPSIGILMEQTNMKLIDYRIDELTGLPNGPFGVLATMMSFFFTLASGISLGLYYKIKSSNIIKVRDKAKTLEKEFTNALFQLANRLEDGLPSEVALSKVAESLEGSVSGEFFKQAAENVQRLGMNVEDAIFNEKTGAIKIFPSALIASTMKVLIESAKRGPKIASEAMTNVSTYIKEIHKVDERLKDLMAETISSMKSQIKMLTPLISAIVVGITSFIVSILGTVAQRNAEISADSGSSTLQTMGDLFGEGLPVYYFQIVVGLYVVQIVYILTIIINGIENGSDKLAEEYQLGHNLIKTTLMYIGVAVGAVLAFTLLGMTVFAG